MQKCKYFQCENEVTGNYPCCDSPHGIALKHNLQVLPILFDADDNRTANPEFNLRQFMTIEMAEYYAEQ